MDEVCGRKIVVCICERGGWWQPTATTLTNAVTSKNASKKKKTSTQFAPFATMTSVSPVPMQQHSSEPQESSQNTFHPYSENQVPISHKLEAWCPSADLIALVSHDNKLELYRLSWRLHWSVPVKAPAPSDKSRPGSHATLNRFGGSSQYQRVSAPLAKVASLAWRPDGKYSICFSSHAY